MISRQCMGTRCSLEFYLVCRQAGKKDTWKERYRKRVIQTMARAEEWSRNLIDQFNAELRTGESKREFVGVELISIDCIDDPAPIDWAHKWYYE